MGRLWFFRPCHPFNSSRIASKRKMGHILFLEDLLNRPVAMVERLRRCGGGSGRRGQEMDGETCQRNESAIHRDGCGE
jgi:hypothetical protein